MASAPICSTPNKEKGHALDIIVDDWGADSGDYPDLVLHALKNRGRCAAHRRQASSHSIAQALKAAEYLWELACRR